LSAKRKPKPRRGDVVQVEVGKKSADPVKIRLAGHNCTYLVRVALTDTGPELAELTMIADAGHAIDYESLRAVPARRLAYTAAQHLDRLAGPPNFSLAAVAGRGWPADRITQFAEDTKPPPTVGVLRAVALAEHALSLGLPVRPTVAAQLGVSKTTVDRLLKRAKAEGLFEDRPLPKRPPPQQRDTTE
jgi:hypothetical protein